jgi:short-subunit dehydrogenase
MKKLPFRENVTIITGASFGLGRELAQQLADQGAWLALAARDANRLGEVAVECSRRGARAIVIPTDVSKQSQCANLIERTVAEYGKIDTLVNNAGQSMFARFDELRDLRVLEALMQVNYFGSVYCTFQALPYLKATKGRIVSICSLAGKTGVPTRTGYSASKHAIAGFCEALRVECEKDGVTVTVIFPGFVATGMRERALGPDGMPLGLSPHSETGVMTVEKCAQLTVKAIIDRRRELVMTIQGKVGQWLKLAAPRLVDSMARKAVERGH